jgi:hypothetical protein
MQRASVNDAFIARLFSRMASLYGEAFARMWAGLDLDDVKRTWCAGLQGHTSEALQRGVTALFHEKYPPTLPRFIELCTGVAAFVPPKLEAPHAITPAGREALAKIDAMLAPIRERMHAQSEHVRQAGRPVSDSVMLPQAVPSPHIYASYGTEDALRDAAFAQEQAKREERQQRPAMRSREPGEDDEPFHEFGNAHGFTDPHERS